MAWIVLVDTVESQWLSVSGSNPSHIVKVKNTLKQFCYPEWLMEAYQQRQFGTTSKPLEATSSQKLTSCMGDSRVRTLVLREMEKAWKVSEAVFSSNCVAWSKKSIQDSSFWKTSQVLELGVFEKLLENLQLWGMTVDGRVSLPRMLERHISGKGGSCLVAITVGTPTASGTVRSERFKTRIPNPVELAGGPLNPQWVEWLMGVPIGHTELEPWATVWFRNKQKKRL